MRSRFSIAVWLALLAGLVWMMTKTVGLGGEIAEGHVVGKEEAFVMTEGDTVSHMLKVTYRFQPPDSPSPQSGAHQVDVQTYERLRVGSVVPVRYSRLPGLGFYGSSIADSTWMSRMNLDFDSVRSLAEIGGFAVVVVLAVLAYRRKSQLLRFVAVVAGMTWLSGVLFIGFLAFPVLFWYWRRSREKMWGVALLLSMALSVAVLNWRIPRPPPEPSGPTEHASAVVRHVEVVSQIWHTSGEGAQGIARPFQMADLEFTPAGASEPVHLLDRVDLDSVPALRDGAMVPVLYSAGNPRSGRIDGGSRTYPRAILEYLLALTFGITAAAGLVVVAFGWAGRAARSSRLGATVTAAQAGLREFSQLPPEDPRRKRIEEMIRERTGKSS